MPNTSPRTIEAFLVIGTASFQFSIVMRYFKKWSSPNFWDSMSSNPQRAARRFTDTAKALWAESNLEEHMQADHWNFAYSWQAAVMIPCERQVRGLSEDLSLLWYGCTVAQFITHKNSPPNALSKCLLVLHNQISQDSLSPTPWSSPVPLGCFSSLTGKGKIWEWMSRNSRRVCMCRHTHHPH